MPYSMPRFCTAYRKRKQKEEDKEGRMLKIKYCERKRSLSVKTGFFLKQWLSEVSISSYHQKVHGSSC